LGVAAQWPGYNERERRVIIPICFGLGARGYNGLAAGVVDAVCVPQC